MKSEKRKKGKVNGRCLFVKRKESAAKNAINWESRKILSKVVPSKKEKVRNQRCEGDLVTTSTM